MTLVLAPTVRIADTRPVSSAVPGPFTGDDIHRRRGHTNEALGDLRVPCDAGRPSRSRPSAERRIRSRPSSLTIPIDSLG
jgi:hypothetical protein